MAGAGLVGRASTDRRLSIELLPLFEKLKPGPGLSRDQVLANQQLRLRTAIISLVATRGWNGVRVRTLARMANVSSASFYRSFSNTDECLASAVEETMAEVARRARSVQRPDADWHVSLRAVLKAIAEQMASHLDATRVFLVDAFSAGPATRRRVPPAIADLENVLIRSFETAPNAPPVPRHLVAGMTAGMLRVIRRAALSGDLEELPALAGPLSQWMASLAQHEVISLLTRPSPPSRPERRPFPTAAGEGPPPAAGDRDCLLRAAARISATEGYASLDPARIRMEAGVPRRRFEQIFPDAEECFLESVDRVATEETARAHAWSTSADGWARRTCRLIHALSAQAARKPHLGRLVFIEVVAAGRAGLFRREQLITRASTALLETVPPDLQLSELSAEASVAAAWHIAQVDIACGRGRLLPAVAPLLSYVILAPITGATTAAEFARRESG